MVCVVIPAYQSCAELPELLGQLTGRVDRIVVSVNNCPRATLKEALSAGAVVAVGAKGRGAQLALGAQWAGADQTQWLLFLHADNILPENWAECIKRHIAQCPQAAGYFRFRADQGGLSARVMDWGVALRCFFWRLPYGDQGLLIPRQMYNDLGGYLPQGLFEDVALIDALKEKYGRNALRPLSGFMQVNMQRYTSEGLLARGWKNLKLLRDYRRGADIDDLIARYQA